MDYSERQTLRNRKVGLQVSMPIALAEVLDRIAESEQAPLATVILRVLRKGMAVERDERALVVGPPQVAAKPRRPYATGTHWTQRPENREKLLRVARSGREARKAVGAVDPVGGIVTG